MKMLTSVGAGLMRQQWMLVMMCLLLCAAPLFAQTGVPVGPMMCYYGPGQYLPCNTSPPATHVSDPFQISRVRYEAVLARLRAFGAALHAHDPPDRRENERSRQRRRRNRGKRNHPTTGRRRAQ